MEIFTGIDKIESATHGDVWRILRAGDVAQIKTKLSIAVYRLQINSSDHHTLYLFDGRYTESNYSTIRHMLHYPDIIKYSGLWFVKLGLRNVTIPARYGVIR